jgi:hypothetical protein
LIQVCYECGAERVAAELVDDLASERLNNSLAAARSQLASVSGRIVYDPRNRDEVAAQVSSRKFALVK